MVSLRGNNHSAGPPMNYGHASGHNGGPVGPPLGIPVGLQGSLGMPVPTGLQQPPVLHMQLQPRSAPTPNGSVMPKHDPHHQLLSNMNCMLSSHHYRMPSQGRAECYLQAPGTGGYMNAGVAAPAGNMAQGGLRGAAPAAQAPTTTQPHAAPDLNKQVMAHNFMPAPPSAPQQQSRPQMFPSQFRAGAQQIRPTTHHRHAAPLYQGSAGGGSTQMIYPMLYQSHGVLPQQYHGTPQRPTCYPQNVILHQNPYCIPYQQNQPPQQYYYQTASPLLAPTSRTSPAPTGRNTTNLVASQGPPQAASASGAHAPSLQHPLPPQTHMHHNMTVPRPPNVTQGQPLRKKRSFAITIKDPKTGEDVCADLFSESQPLSGESSERHTPQPETMTNSVAEEFSRMVIETLKQNTQESSNKPIFLPKGSDASPAPNMSSVTQPRASATHLSNNNILKSDMIPLTENKIVGADIAVECNETPVVSAISDSPVIVPKLCPTVIKVQKSTDMTVTPLPLDTSKNMSAKQNKQSKIKPLVPIPDENKLVSEVTAAAVAPVPAIAPTFNSVSKHMAPHTRMPVPAHMAAPTHITMPTNVAAPPFIPGAAASYAPVPAYIVATPPAYMPVPEAAYVPAVDLTPAHVSVPAQVLLPPPVSAPASQPVPPPQPQRPRKSSNEARNNRNDSSSLSQEKVDTAVSKSNLNGPHVPVTKNLPVEIKSSSDVELKKSEFQKEIQPFATEILAATIESEQAPMSQEQEEIDLSFANASQAQAKLHQSLASCSKNKGKELRETEIDDAEVVLSSAQPQSVSELINDVTKTDTSTIDKVVEENSNIAEDIANTKIVNDDVVYSNNEEENIKHETDAKIIKELVKPSSPAIDEIDFKPELKTSLTVKPVISEKPSLKYHYKENQWSPLNTEGKKCYDRDFLLQLQDDPQSKKKPDNVHKLSVVLKSKTTEGFVLPMNISRPNSESFIPAFAKSMPSKGPSREREREPKKTSMMVNKPSIKGSASGGGNSSSSCNKNIIHVSLSLRSDVKLNESENAWKPTSRIKNSQLDGEDQQTQELYKKFRGILNKLTPQKFDRLLDQVKHLEITTQARLEGVIDLIFEKAIDEPSFSVAYAAMCNKLSMLKVPADNSSDQYVNFRPLIISKCQAQFETTKVQEGILKLEEELANCTDAARKKELVLMLNEENRKVRMRSVGNVRFIGELYKLKMLTSKIMLYCLNYLIDKLDEEKLECLCKLLTTIGEQVESEVKPQLDAIFKNIKDIVERKSNKISSRVRFMLQDVIELRRKRWSSKNDAQPKTMDQIQKEAEHKHRQIEIMNAAPMGREFRREDGGRSKRGSDNRRAAANSFQENWPSNKRPQQQYQVDTSKLKAATNTNKNLSNIKLGPPQHPWNHGSGAKTSSHGSSNSVTLPTTTNNMYSVLENVNTDPSILRGSKENTPSYHSKGASIERSTFNSKSEFAGSISGASGPARSSSSGRSGGSEAERHAGGGGGGGGGEGPPPPLSEPERKIIRAIIDFNHSDEEILQEIKTKFKPIQHSNVISEILNYALEKSSKTYPQIKKSLLSLVSTNTISRESFIAGLSDILEVAPDLHIDIPKLYDYLAFFVAPFIIHKHLELVALTATSDKIISENHGHLFLRCLINELKNDMGPSYVRLKWEEVGLELNEWMEDEQALKFKEEKNNEFLFAETMPTEDISLKKLNNQEIQQKLLHLMTIDQSCECVKGWIRDHVGKASSEEWFMRTLIQAVCEYALFGSNMQQAPRFNQDRMTKYIHLINEYGDNKEARDANCLLGIQLLVHRLEHPKGVTLEIFQYLSDHYIIQREGFLAFEKSEAEPEGKGVMMKALVSFYTNINEVDNEDSCSED